MGQVADLLGPDLEAELDVGGVDALPRGGDEVDLPEAGIIEVADRPLQPREHLVVVPVVAGGQRDVLVQRGGEDVRLERRARLARRPAGAVEALPVGPAVVGHDLAAARLHRDQRAEQGVVALLPARDLLDGLHRSGLGLLAQRRRHVQPADLAEPPRLELVRDGLHDVPLGPGQVGAAGAALLGELGVLRARPLDRVEPALADHPVEDVRPALACPLRVLGRLVARRRADGGGEHRALLRGEVGGGGAGAEVGPAGGLDAVRAAAEVDRVEVVLEDLLLAALAGHLQRDEHLLDLARVGAVRGEEGVLGVLLRDRRAALLHAPAATHVGEQRAGDAARADAGLGVEAAVLGREHRLLRRLAHLRQRHQHAVGPEAGELGAVGVAQDGRLLGHGVLGRGDVDDRVADAEQDQHREQPGGQPDQDDPLPGQGAQSSHGPSLAQAGVWWA